jgi:Na+-translocating ferredoxin:NAD+ oxidoreductase subunit A
MSWLSILFASLFGSNILLTKFVDIYAMQSLKKLDVAFYVGLFMIDVTVVSSILVYGIYHFVLLPFNLTFLTFLIAVIMIAFVSEIEELILKKFLPKHYEQYGFYFPLISMNAVITATILLVINPQMDFWTMLAYAIFIPVGFIGVIILMAIYQERFDKLRMTPKAFQGMAITLITLALIAMALLGFGGL